MKKFIIAGLIAVTGIAFTATSCGKYEDGPKLSLLTKKSRLANEWVLESYEANGSDQTSTMQAFLGNDYVWTIEKDGGYTQVSSTNGINVSGTWEMGEDKDDVTFRPSSGSSTTFRILRLKSKELWLRYTNSNGTYDISKWKQK